MQFVFHQKFSSESIKWHVGQRIFSGVYLLGTPLIFMLPKQITSIWRWEQVGVFFDVTVRQGWL